MQQTEWRLRIDEAASLVHTTWDVEDEFHDIIPSLPRCPMRPLGWIGVALIVAGGIILVMRGVSYTKNRSDIELGPVKVAAVEKGFVPPVIGVVAMLVGAGLVFAGRRRA